MPEKRKKTLVITGGSRGIGLAIALRFADAGWNIAIVTKDSQEAIALAERQIAAFGALCFILSADIGDQKQIEEAAAKAVATFGGIDALVNNTSATCFTGTMDTTPEQFDLVLSTSARAAFFMAQACLPALFKAENPHILNISPPLNIDAHWFKNHLAFSMAKFAMSLCTLGMSEEFRQQGVAINSLWPQTTIATQTIKDHFSSKVYSGSRWPAIMGDAAFEIVKGTSRNWTGRFFTDEAVLRDAGITDFTNYAVDPDVPLMQPLFIPLKSGMAPLSRDLFNISGQRP